VLGGRVCGLEPTRRESRVSGEKEPSSFNVWPPAGPNSGRRGRKLTGLSLSSEEEREGLYLQRKGRSPLLNFPLFERGFSLLRK